MTRYHPILPPRTPDQEDEDAIASMHERFELEDAAECGAWMAAGFYAVGVALAAIGTMFALVPWALGTLMWAVREVARHDLEQIGADS